MEKGMVRHWNELSKEILNTLEVFKVRLDRTLGTLIWRNVSAHGKGIGTTWPLQSLPTCFYDSVIL